MPGAAKTTKKAHSASVTRAGSLTPGRSAAFFRAARSAGFFGPVMRKASLEPGRPAQARSQQARRPAREGGRPHCREGHADAGRERRGSAAASRRRAPQVLQRSERAHRRVAADAQAEIQRATTGGGGQALTRDVRRSWSRGSAPTSARSASTPTRAPHSLSNHLSARAFTYRNHVFFGRDQYQPGTDDGPPPARARADAHHPAGRHRPARGPARSTARGCSRADAGHDGLARLPRSSSASACRTPSTTSPTRRTTFPGSGC